MLLMPLHPRPCSRQRFLDLCARACVYLCVTDFQGTDPIAMAQCYVHVKGQGYCRSFAKGSL